MAWALKKVDVADGSVELAVMKPGSISEITGVRPGNRSGRTSSWTKWEFYRAAIPSESLQNLTFYYVRGALPKYLEIVNPRPNFYKLFRPPADLRLGATLLAEISEDDLAISFMGQATFVEATAAVKRAEAERLKTIAEKVNAQTYEKIRKAAEAAGTVDRETQRVWAEAAYRQLLGGKDVGGLNPQGLGQAPIQTAQQALQQARAQALLEQRAPGSLNRARVAEQQERLQQWIETRALDLVGRGADLPDRLPPDPGSKIEFAPRRYKKAEPEKPADYSQPKRKIRFDK